MTLCTLGCIAVLVLLETFSFLRRVPPPPPLRPPGLRLHARRVLTASRSVHTVERIGVDRSFGGRLTVNIDIVFPSSPCRCLWAAPAAWTGPGAVVPEPDCALLSQS